MKVFLFWLIIIVCCCSCTRGKYYVSGIFRKGDVTNMDTLLLDSSYQFFRREVYRSKNEKMENILNTNVEKDNTANKVRIEVEYLLLSWEHKNALYISTIPDKYQRYYSFNNTTDTLINAYDFSTFHFGKITPDGEDILYTSTNGKNIISWDIRPFINNIVPQKITIREIAIQQNDLVENVILINKALEEPLVFTHQKNFGIIFEEPNGEPDSCRDASSICRLADNKIYFNPIKHGYDIFFRFNKSIHDSKDSAIGFDYKRIRYSPFQAKK